MKKYFFAFLSTAIAACSDSAQQSPRDSAPDTIAVQDSSVNGDVPDVPEQRSCDIEYDTITNPNYLAHLNIMKRYFTPGKRAWSTIGKDTMETWLYPQDIGVFFQELDSTEQGIYRMMTNKIVFLMLNHDARSIIFPPYSELQKHYFLWQVEHPVCTDAPIDSTLARVQRNMPAKTPEMKQFRDAVLASLENDKKH